jgi:hypothetical protein
MKLVRTLAVVGLGLAGANLALAISCGGSSSSQGNNSEAGAGEAGKDAGPSIVPPPAPTGPMTMSTTHQNLALHKLFLGDTTRDGTADMNAWASYGYNLDGKFTTAASTDVCTLAAGAPKSTQTDGNGGIDNSFGENILPIIMTAAGSGTSDTINSSIDKGSFTIMFDVVGLSTDPMQTATGLSGSLYAGGKFPGMPTWSMADNWPVRPELLNDPMDVTKGSKVSFSSAYIVNGTFVNGQNVDLTLSLSVQGVSLDITVHHSVITFDHKTSGCLSTATDACAQNGTIAGIINSMELVNALGLVIGRVTNGSICPGSGTFTSIAGQITQASDIMVDGTNNAGTACDGISIGLGFEADHIGDPTTVAPAGCVAADPCNPEAGTTCDAGPPPPPMEAGPDSAGD